MYKLDPESALDDPQRLPLPAGDPLCWSLLIGGTLLDGLPWPGWKSIIQPESRS